MSDCENNNLRMHFLIHDAERKPMQHVPPEYSKVTRPTLWSPFDCLYGFTHRQLKI
jgi:hypothetical protein